MADTRTQQQLSSEQQRGMTRRQEHWPARDAFAFSPFSMMRRLTEEMDRAFSRGSGDWGFTPAIDVRQRDGNIEICAELPGMSKDDVKVECTNEGIILQGEKRREQESDEGGWHRSERSYGSFYRMIPLPEGADAEKAKAEFKDGVLDIKVPVREPERKTREIPIEGAK
jgi:HSP20 family protein